MARTPYSSHSSEGHCALMFNSVSLSKPITIPLELSGLTLIALAIHRTDSQESS